MIMFKKFAILGLVLALALFAGIQSASADEHEGLPACEGESVSGSLVYVDAEAGVAVIDDGEELCVVNINSTDGNQITDLFEEQFGTTDSEGVAAQLEEALIARSTYLVFDESLGEWVLASEEDEGAVPALINTVVDNGDGTYSLEFSVEGEVDPVLITSDDGELAASFMDALNSAFVEFALQTNSDGSTSIVDAGDLAQQYHEEGMGWGVLVKLFSMAQDLQEACTSAEPDPELSTEACLASLDSLVAEFNGGTGLGLLFQEYGKPSLLGVGHMRHGEDGNNGHGNGNAFGISGDKVPGYCKDKGNNGNGNGNANGKSKKQENCD